MPSPRHIHEESRVTDIPFTCDFCNNYSDLASPASLCLTSPRPRPTRSRVPYLMSSSPSSRVPKSQAPHTSPDVPVPLSPSHFYTQPLTGTFSHRLNTVKHPAVREATGKLESLLLSQRIRPCLDYFPKAVTKIQRIHFQLSNNDPRAGLLESNLNLLFKS